MYALTLDSFVKPDNAARSQPAGLVHMEIKAADYRRLEEAEAQLQREHKREMMIEIDPRELNLELPKNIPELEDCQMRVYIHDDDERGHFHLVGHCKGDHRLFYTNAVMVDYMVN
ncbi:MAG: hypothetical protein R3183_10600 [Oleiphilaceae bacterium]|nr:hypothetical protein [Oleiphilaceae bacterium]